MKYTYILENLNCAHCAGKIERAIAAAEGYDTVSFNFATKELRFKSERKDTLAEIQAICDSIEDGVTVRDAAEEKEESSGTAERVLLLIGLAFGASALVLHLLFEGAVSDYVILALSLAATLFAGWKVFVKGLKNLLHFRIEETVLMTVAVIAAFVLGEYVEGAMVTLLFTIGELIEDYAVDASRRDIEKLSNLRPDTAVILRNGKEEEIPAAEVEIGSTVIVKPHARIPLDGVVTEGSSAIDNSALTGESLPVLVQAGDEALSGGVNGDALLTIRTTKAFGDSTAARILQIVRDAAARKGKSEKLISRFASVYTPIVVGLAVLIAVVPPLLGFGSFSEWIYNALVVLVASCPCAIVISVPLAYFAGIGAASRQGMLIKGGKYLEALAQADSFVFDKTGTLTTGQLSVNRAVSVSEYSDAEILSLAAAAEQYSAHPIAAAIRKSVKGSSYTLSDFSEIAGKGTQAQWNGKTLCCGRRTDENLPESVRDCNVFLTLDGRLLGAIQVSDTVREESKSVLAQLKKLGVKRTLILTGDGRAAASSVAAQVGADEVQAELLPEDKLRAVEALEGTVCFVGDGINDAPVLAVGDCGIAMGLGSDAAIEASDAVLSAGTLHALPKAVQTARRTMRTIRANIIFALAVKAAVIILACFGLAAIWMSVIADTGVCVLCVLYTARLLKAKK